MTSDQTSTKPAELRAAAELIGGLLLREVEAADLERLREPELRDALSGIGIELPSPAEQGEWLEQRGADYHDLFLRPEAGPLVQSLWTQGRYEGDSAVRIRKLAEAAAVEFQRDLARGAAPDHLGSILLLWCSTSERAPEIAEEIAREHLRWAAPPLGRIADQGGFYGRVASAASLVIEMISPQGE